MTVKAERIEYYMEIWARLAAGDRDSLKEHFPDSEEMIGYYDGYRTAAEDVLRFLRGGRFEEPSPPVEKPHCERCAPKPRCVRCATNT